MPNIRLKYGMNPNPSLDLPTAIPHTFRILCISQSKQERCENKHELHGSLPWERCLSKKYLYRLTDRSLKHSDESSLSLFKYI